MNIKRRSLVVGAAVLLLFAAAVFKYADVFANIAAIFVYVSLFLLVLTPLCRRFENTGLSPSSAAALTVASVFVCLSVILIFVLPYLVIHTVRMISQCLPVLQNTAGQMEMKTLQSGYAALTLKEMASSFISYAAKAASIVVRGSLSAAAETGRVFFSLVIAYYALRERSILSYHLQLLMPIGIRSYMVLTLNAGRNAVMGYFSGQLKTCLFVGSATCVSLLFLNIPDAVILGILMGILEIIPYMGPFIGAIPILLSAIPMGIGKTLLTAALIFLIQQTESSFVGPYFTASSTAVHPITALLSVYVLGSLFGLWGILLAVPCIIMLQSVSWAFLRFRNVMNA